MISKAETPKTRESSITAEKKKKRKNKSAKETLKQPKDNIIKFDEAAEVPTEQHVSIQHKYIRNGHVVEPQNRILGTYICKNDWRIIMHGF